MADSAAQRDNLFVERTVVGQTELSNVEQLLAGLKLNKIDQPFQTIEQSHTSIPFGVPGSTTRISTHFADLPSLARPASKPEDGLELLAPDASSLQRLPETLCTAPLSNPEDETTAPMRSPITGTANAEQAYSVKVGYVYDSSVELHDTPEGEHDQATSIFTVFSLCHPESDKSGRHLCVIICT